MADEEDTSIRDDIAAAMEPVADDAPVEELEAPAELIDAPSGEAESVSPDETDTEKAERLRDEKGKFATPDKAVKADNSTDGEVNADPSDPNKPDQGKDVEEKGAETRPLTPPTSWTAEERAEWDDLPPKAQGAVLRREADRNRAFDQKNAEINQVKERYSELDRTLEPIRANLQRAGISEAGYFGRLMEADRRLQTDPVGALKWLAQQSGVDLSQLNQTESELEPDPYTDELKQQLAQQNERLSRFEQQQQQAVQLSEQQRQQSLTDTVQGFAAEVDEAGNLKHPHFQDLSKHMGSLLESGAASSMEDAYEQALWATPQHRDSMLTQRQRETERKIEADRKARADKAKAANVSITGSPGGAEPPGEVGTVGEELRKAMGAGR